MEREKRGIKGAGYTGPVGSGRDGEVKVTPDSSAGVKGRAEGISPVAGGSGQMTAPSSRSPVRGGERSGAFPGAGTGL